MTEIKFILAEEALLLHETMIHMFKGSNGIRDIKTFESAINRPLISYYEDIEEYAACYFESLLINHPFIDGNKRTAFGVMHVFLKLNGYDFNKKITDEILYDFVIDTIKLDSKNRFDFIVSFLQNNIYSLGENTMRH